MSWERWALVIAYNIIGWMAAFVTRKGIAARAPGKMLVMAAWPVLVVVVGALILVEMIVTWGEGYPEDDDDG